MINRQSELSTAIAIATSTKSNNTLPVMRPPSYAHSNSMMRSSPARCDHAASPGPTSSSERPHPRSDEFLAENCRLGVVLRRNGARRSESYCWVRSGERGCQPRLASSTNWYVGIKEMGLTAKLIALAEASPATWIDRAITSRYPPLVDGQRPERPRRDAFLKSDPVGLVGGGELHQVLRSEAGQPHAHALKVGRQVGTKRAAQSGQIV
jgi:hypothetical protein